MIRFVQHLQTRENGEGLKRGMWVAYDGEGKAVQVVPYVLKRATKPEQFRDVPELLTHRIRTADYYLLTEFAERKGWLASEPSQARSEPQPDPRASEPHIYRGPQDQAWRTTPCELCGRPGNDVTHYPTTKERLR